MTFYRVLFFILFTLSSTALHADTTNIKATGTKSVFIPINPNKNIQNNPEIAALGGKYITVEVVKLSPEAKRLLAAHIKKPLPQPKKSWSIPNKIALGMNNVPVLDQGRHNTCATFSTTAIIDALYGEDLISQLCYLELTHYLNQKSFHKNGWEGSNSTAIITDLTRYGAVLKSDQQKQGCAGVYEYPANDAKNTGNPMTTNEYLDMSTNVMKHVDYTYLLREWEAFSNTTSAANLVSNIKNTLSRGNRVLISILLDTNFGVGNLGTYKVARDAWIITPEIRSDIEKGKLEGRHGLVVTAYDDDAYIYDRNKTPHKGVFTVRNSWGGQFGDNGEFYVSYEYMQALTYSAIEVAARS